MDYILGGALTLLPVVFYTTIIAGVLCVALFVRLKAMAKK